MHYVGHLPRISPIFGNKVYGTPGDSDRREELYCAFIRNRPRRTPATPFITKQFQHFIQIFISCDETFRTDRECEEMFQLGIIYL